MQVNSKYTWVIKNKCEMEGDRGKFGEHFLII